MNNPPVKIDWLERTVQVYNYHVSKLKENPRWTLSETAKELNRSLGSVSQDLLVARFVTTHEKQLRRLNSMREAVAFVRSKEREMKTREI